MNDLLAGLGFFALIGAILAGQWYRAEILIPRREARLTGKPVYVSYPNGLKTFLPDGSTSFHRYF